MNCRCSTSKQQFISYLLHTYHKQGRLYGDWIFLLQWTSIKGYILNTFDQCPWVKLWSSPCPVKMVQLHKSCPLLIFTQQNYVEDKAEFLTQQQRSLFATAVNEINEANVCATAVKLAPMNSTCWQLTWHTRHFWQHSTNLYLTSTYWLATSCTWHTLLFQLKVRASSCTLQSGKLFAQQLSLCSCSLLMVPWIVRNALQVHKSWRTLFCLNMRWDVWGLHWRHVLYIYKNPNGVCDSWLKNMDVGWESRQKETPSVQKRPHLGKKHELWAKVP